MKLISCNIADSSSISKEHCLRRGALAKNLLLLRQQGALLKSSPSFTCSSHLSRNYVEQISSVAWTKTKYGRPRSNSYPFIKGWNPLPRVIEEDESLEATPSETHPTTMSNDHVQTFNWTDNTISEEWLNNIDSMRSSLMDSSWPKVKRGRPRSHSFPFVKRLNPLPCVTEEDETAEDEKPAMTNVQVPQIQILNWTDNKLPHELLDKINSLRSTLSTTDHSPRPQGPYHSAKLPAAKSTRGEKPVGLEKLRQLEDKTALIEHTSKAVEENNNNHPRVKIENASQVRKPDSTYILLISGFTHDTSHAQSVANNSDTNENVTDCKLKREKKCKKLKCIVFSPRKLFCSPARQHVHRHVSDSSEYIPQVGS